MIIRIRCTCCYIATSEESLRISPQDKQTVCHIIASIYNAKDIAEELLDFDCALDVSDEEVRHVHIFS